MLFRNAVIVVLMLQWSIKSCSCISHPLFISCDEKKPDDGRIYHIEAYRFGFFNVFSRLQMLVKSTSHFKVFQSNNKGNLIKDMEAKEAGFFGWMLSRLFGSLADGSDQYSNGTRLELSPFSDNYVGFSSDADIQNITVICNFTAFDAKLLALFLVGTFVFLFAESFSRNVMFYYASGVTISLFMSWIIVLIIIIKLIPYKKSIFAVTVVGGSFGLYLTQSLLLNLQFYAKHHAYWLIWYTAIVSLLSLAFLYYKGPPTNIRFLNLTKWCMQLLGLMCIYNCTWAKEVAVTAIVFAIATQLVFLHFDINRFFKKWISALFIDVFKSIYEPPQRRFLTAEEYQEETRRETAKAIKELRGYCSSPECDTWKVVSRLKDPKKFASFIKTGNMFDDDELEEYERYEPEEGSESWVSSDDAAEIEVTRNENLEQSMTFSDVSIDNEESNG